MPPRTQGQLSLSFNRTDSQTSMRVLTQTPPLRVIRAFALDDGMASVHLHNVSGGVLGGDDLTLTAHVGRGAWAQLTTPGATRVYRHRAGHADAIQRNDLRVAENGLLEYLPDPLIPFAESRYRQQTTVTLAAGAGLFWWETLAPGRTARDEMFAYEQLDMTVDIQAEGRPIALERMCLRPADQPPKSLVRFGQAQYMTTFYICRVGQSPATWSALEAELSIACQRLSQPNETAWGVSTLVTHGVVVRGLSTDQEPLSQGLLNLWQIAKQRLYDTAAIPPRKLR